MRKNICELCSSISDTYKGNAEKVVLINTSDVYDGKCTNHTLVENKQLRGQFKKTFKPNDILYSEIRPANRRFAYIDFDTNNYIASTKLMVLRAKEGVNPKYLYQILRGNSTINALQLLAESRSGTFPQITFSELSNIEVNIPSEDVQNMVVSILSSLDAKIETNNKLNEKLEEMAQAIFKSWFVDFEPFKDQPFHETELGMIPEGWEVTTIGENLKTALGGTPSRNRDDYWNGEIAWINSGEINKFRIIQASEYITENGLKSSATKLLPAKTTVLAITGATLGQVSLLEIDTCANQSVIGVLESDAIKHQFIYPLIKSQIKYLILHQTGGAQQHINKQNVDSIQFVLPPKDILDEYQIITKKIFDQISTLCFENQRLASLRDTLLPRLMSGEIKI